MVKFTLEELKRDALLTRAAAISFRILLSLFPAMLVLFAIIPLIPIHGFGNTLLDQLQGIMPEEAFHLISSSMHEIATRIHPGILSIGVLLSINFSVQAVLGLVGSFNKTHFTFRRRSGFQRILVAFKITGLLFLLFLVSVFFVIYGGRLVRTFMHHAGATSAFTFLSLSVLKWLIIIFFYYLGISLIYFYGPAVNTRWRFFSAGSTLATMLSIIVSVLFSFFINNFGRLNQIFGSIGALIMIMLWILYNSLSLLIGFELNTSIDFNKQKRKDPPDPAS